MFRISLRINPILVILSLLIGYKIYGVAGALLALPVATIIRQTVRLSAQAPRARTVDDGAAAALTAI